MSTAPSRDRSFLEEIHGAVEIAAKEADDVDRAARFPREAIAALRTVRALSAHVPPQFGGGGVSFAAVADGCFELGRACAATGMVFAMHQIQVGSLVRHRQDAAPLERYLEELSERQLLIASATSEVGVGGDLRTSIAAAGASDGLVGFEKRAPTISYGAEADDLLVTVRRAPDADPSDQVLVLVRNGERELEQVSEWDPLGMRGTCSPGFILRAKIDPAQVLPVAFGEIATKTMVPFSHILWAHVWLGIATDAYDRARAFVRERARTSPGLVPPQAARLSELATLVHRMRSEVEAATSEYSSILESEDAQGDLATIGYAIRVNTLKVSASDLAPQICTLALTICGMAGYQNGMPFSVGRHLRDALSAGLMIGNDRIHATNAALLLVHKG